MTINNSVVQKPRGGGPGAKTGPKGHGDWEPSCQQPGAGCESESLRSPPSFLQERCPPWSLLQTPPYFGCAGVECYCQHESGAAVIQLQFLINESKWLYIGTERGNIHIVNVESFTLSGYVIMWNKAIEL
ncbi:Syntaxin-binding protein 5 [Liparis tanakae]|uniref:Syntaxin-binding protein 5 n=1 Tax=Liparis tanakae TaxID=230148 RepID=A0A4Z2EG87_9TELE|nr:Syntaxin-binding protein 5 [Liparis tanakae]